MPPQSRLSFLHPASLLATWFGSGLLPKAPGTWGSLAALPFAALIIYLGGPWALLAASLFAYAVGLWASERYAAAMGLKDPGAVVIDEVAGQWLALVPACLDPVAFGIGFILFRLFDVMKTWPANVLERKLPGGLGIMSDDMIAGFYAALGVYLYLSMMGDIVCFPMS